MVKLASASYLDLLTAGAGSPGQAGSTRAKRLVLSPIQTLASTTAVPSHQADCAFFLGVVSAAHIAPS